eukprot:scaffold101182_cov74-Phaeocystis_antarctica.AAC.3
MRSRLCAEGTSGALTTQVLRSTPTRTTARGTATRATSSQTRTSCSPGSRPSSSRCSRGCWFAGSLVRWLAGWLVRWRLPGGSLSPGHLVV